MKLLPSHPPGRSNRKALAFVDEIACLVAQGYSAEAIRRALADAGVVVSKSSVQREVARVRARADRGESRSAASALSAPLTPLTPLAPRASFPAAQTEISTATAQRATPSGKDVAKAFMKTQIINPLLRAKEPR